MTKVAFYAPMKPPDHPVPSGDREMARNLMLAIAANGAQVDLVSDLRIYDSAGDPVLQAELRKKADAEIQRLCTHLSTHPPDLWVTYHNYYKSPDLIGPTICRVLNLPYVQIETSRAKSRLNGPWAQLAAAAETASDAADLIFYLIDHDRSTLERDRVLGQSLAHLRPFLPENTLPAPADCGAANRPMLAVAMMRERDKLASYQIIADTLACLGDTPWQLDIAGDGPARPQVQALMAPFQDRVRFLGQLNKNELADAYHRSSLFFWPGVNEAYGMVYLEAQAAGLPVVAQNRHGVSDVILPGPHPSPEKGPQALAENITSLLTTPDLRRNRADAARKMVQDHHLLPAATTTFWSAVSPLLEKQS